MRISDWSSDVCSSDLIERCEEQLREALLNSDVGLLDSLLGDDLIFTNQDGMRLTKADDIAAHQSGLLAIETLSQQGERIIRRLGDTAIVCLTIEVAGKYRSEEHTSELQSLMRTSYAVFCLKKKKE